METEWTVLRMGTDQLTNDLSIQLVGLIALSLAAASISFTITTTGMFKWFRELVSPIHKKVEELVHCPWCLGHWVVFVIMLTADIPILQVTGIRFYDWLFTAFTVISPIGVIHYILLRAYEPVAKAMMRRTLDNLNK